MCKMKIVIRDRFEYAGRFIIEFLLKFYLMNLFPFKRCEKRNLSRPDSNFIDFSNSTGRETKLELHERLRLCHVRLCYLKLVKMSNILFVLFSLFPCKGKARKISWVFFESVKQHRNSLPPDRGLCFMAFII